MVSSLLRMLPCAVIALQALIHLPPAVRLRASHVLLVRMLEPLLARVLAAAPAATPAPVLAAARPAPLANMPQLRPACARRAPQALGRVLDTALATTAMLDIIPMPVLQAARTAPRARILRPPERECVLRVRRARIRESAMAHARRVLWDDTARALGPADVRRVLQERIQVPAAGRRRV